MGSRPVPSGRPFRGRRPGGGNQQDSLALRGPCARWQQPFGKTATATDRGGEPGRSG